MSEEFIELFCQFCSAPLSYFSGDKPQICFCYLNTLNEEKKPVALEDQELLFLYIESIKESLPRENGRIRRLAVESALAEEFYKMGTITKAQADKFKLELRLHFYGV